MRWLNYLRPNIESRIFTGERFILPAGEITGRKGYTLVPLIISVHFSAAEMMQISAFLLSLPSSWNLVTIKHPLCDIQRVLKFFES